VFLLGAGASMDAGCLSSKEMLVALNSSIEDAAGNGIKTEFSAIYGFIIQSLVYQRALKGDPESRLFELTNIEDFIAVLRQMLDREYVVPPPLIGNWNSKITGWELKNENVFQEFLDFAYDCLLNKWTKFDKNKAEILLQPIRTILESDEDFKLSIFSLNYDLVFESVFNSEQELLVDVGFSQKRWSGDFADPHSSAKLKLYKLHGSVDWYFDESDEEVKEGVPEGVRPLIVFGSGPKLQSYDPFLSLLGGLRDKLKSASVFVVIGYSFQDKYINNILIQSLSAGLNKKLLVVDPYLPKDEMKFIERVEKFQALKSMNEIVNLTKMSPARVEIHPTSASDFLKTFFANNAQQLKEVLNSTEKGDQIFGNGK
jgi:hypothetical protein